MPFELKLIFTLVSAALSYLLVTLNPPVSSQSDNSGTGNEGGPLRKMMVNSDGTLKAIAKTLIIGYLALLMGFLWVFF